jgi:hypothetical protein
VWIFLEYYDTVSKESIASCRLETNWNTFCCLWTLDDVRKRPKHTVWLYFSKLYRFFNNLILSITILTYKVVVIGEHVFILVTNSTGYQACERRCKDLLFCLFTHDVSGRVNFTNVGLALQRGFSLVACYAECLGRYWGRKVGTVIIYYLSLELGSTQMPVKVDALI